MPTATETPVKAYAFCLDARCGGYLQEKVDGILTVTSWTNFDLGGPGANAGGHTERSTEMVRFADESDAVCTICAGHREISTQLRPEYPNTSGHDPMGLFEFRGKTERELAEFRHNREIDALKQDQVIAEMRREMAELRAMLADKANKPGPKPKEG